jgi:hypothetical protein
MEVKGACADCDGLLAGDASQPGHASLVPWANAPEGQAILQCGKCESLWRFSPRFGWMRVVP